jgi:hypothetical protein
MSVLLAACAETKLPTPKAAAAPEPADVTLTPVKWPEFERALAAHRGRVVVIDLWAEY